MSEENKTVNPKSDENAVNNHSTEAVEKNVPFDRFTEVNNAKNDALKQVADLQSQIDTINAANKKAEEEKMVKQGEYKELLDQKEKELKIVTEKANQWDSYQTSRRENLMTKVTDENDKQIAEGLGLDKLELFVDRITSTQSNATSQARAASGNKGEFGGYGSAEEFAMKDPNGAAQWLQENTVGYKATK